MKGIKIIQRIDHTFNVAGETIKIAHAHFRREGDGYENLVTVSKSTHHTPNGTLHYEYDWGEYYLGSAYFKKDLSMDYLVKECIADILGEPCELCWMHP